MADVDGKYQAVLPRNLPWEVRVGSASFTPQNPGNLKGDIELDFNSVGACVGGMLTFEGYVDWRPYSDFIQVFVKGKRIGLGVIGIPQSTRSESGKRTTQVPIVGLHAIDADGLAALGLGTAFYEVGVGGGVQLLGIASPLNQIEVTQTDQDALGFPVTKTIMQDPPFGETVNAGFQRVFKDNALASWGVRPDGLRVAGVASGGPNFSSAANNVRAQPANYELTSYVSEYAERVAERWQPEYHSRGIGPLMPRRGATIQSDALMGNVTDTPPFAFSVKGFGLTDKPEEATDGYLLGVLNLRDLVAKSAANPQADNVTYSLQGVSITIEVTFDHPALSDNPPEGWTGQNIYKLDTWQDDYAFQPLTDLTERMKKGNQAQSWGELWDYIDSNYFSLETTVAQVKEDLGIPDYITDISVQVGGGTGTTDPATSNTRIVKGNYAGIGKYVTSFIAKDKNYWKDVAQNKWGTSDKELQTLMSGFPKYFDATYPKMYADELARQWDFYLAQIGVQVVWGEWLTKSDTAGAKNAVSVEQDVINPKPPVYAPKETSNSIFGTLASLFDEFAWKMSPRTYQATNEQLNIDPGKDTGLLKAFYRNNKTLNTGADRVLTWTFSVPKELVSQLDTSLGDNYKWVFAVTYNAIRLGMKAKARIFTQKEYLKRKTGSVSPDKDLPGYLIDIFTTPTLQGQIEGEIHTGPFMVDGQQMANAKVVISNENYRTEFQTGAPNGGR